MAQRGSSDASEHMSLAQRARRTREITEENVAAIQNNAVVSREALDLGQQNQRDIKVLQQPGSARLSAYLTGHGRWRDDVEHRRREVGKAFTTRTSKAALALGAFVVALVVLGSRNLVVPRLPGVGELPWGDAGASQLARAP